MCAMSDESCHVMSVTWLIHSYVFTRHITHHVASVSCVWYIHIYIPHILLKCVWYVRDAITWIAKRRAHHPKKNWSKLHVCDTCEKHSCVGYEREAIIWIVKGKAHHPPKKVTCVWYVWEVVMLRCAVYVLQCMCCSVCVAVCVAECVTVCSMRVAVCVLQCVCCSVCCSVC